MSEATAQRLEMQQLEKTIMEVGQTNLVNNPVLTANMI